MLVFNVTFHCAPGMRETFLEQIKARGIDAGARAEPGNLQYDYFRAVDKEDDVLLIEKYRDGDAVAFHVRQSHTAKLVELKEAYVEDMLLEQYERPGEEAR